MIDSAEAESRKSPGSESSAWSEVHRLIGVCTTMPGPAGGSRPAVIEAGLGVVIAFQVGHHAVSSRGPAPTMGAFQASVSIEGRLPTVISERDLAMPVRGWELRGSGLWVDCVCEEAMERWSYGLESFALGIEDPAELTGRGYGERTPLGWELEFEAGSSEPATGSDMTTSSYSQVGMVHGVLLLADGEVEVEGRGERSHRWGEPRGYSPRSAEPNSGVALPTPDGVWWAPVS